MDDEKTLKAAKAYTEWAIRDHEHRFITHGLLMGPVLFFALYALTLFSMCLLEGIL